MEEGKRGGQVTKRNETRIVSRKRDFSSLQAMWTVRGEGVFARGKDTEMERTEPNGESLFSVGLGLRFAIW